MARKEFDYYAFISYSRADEKWAKWIQKQLETYRFPVALKKEVPSLPKKIFPIFRDKTDLTGGELWEELKKQLESSEYLIVICSPTSAKAQWVNNEVSYFQSLGQNSNIIPLIIDGQPHASDEERECFCPALRDSNQEELLGVSIPELGKKKALLRVIASIMRLKYDNLVMRDKKRTLRQRIMASVAGLAAVTAGFGVWWYNIPHNTYYWGYVYRNEIPEGRQEIDSEMRKRASVYYKIVTQRGKVIRLESVNSAGAPEGNWGALAEDFKYPIVEFTYTDKGELASATYKDANGKAQLIKRYDGINAVNLQNPNNVSQISSIPSEIDNSGIISSALEVSDEKITITRELLEHDENGYLTEVRYMWDSRNIPACNSAGVYGERYILDDSGKVIRKELLDVDGGLVFQDAAAAFTYVYNERAQIVEMRSYNAKGEPAIDDIKVSYTEVIIDEDGRITTQIYYGTDGTRCTDENGVCEYRFDYDDKGYMTDTTFFDINGDAAYHKEDGCHHIKYENNEDGVCVMQSYYDADGNAMYNLNAIASVKYTFDSKGQHTGTFFFDTEGQPTYYCSEAESGNMNYLMWQSGADSVMTYGLGGNCAGVVSEYPDAYTSVNTYIGKDGKPSMCLYGYAIMERHLNENGMLDRVSFFDEQRKPVRANYNAASIEYTYNDSSRLVSERFYDENGELCENMLGATEQRIVYDQGGKPSAIRYLDADGEPCWVRSGDSVFSQIKLECNSAGQITSIKYLDTDGIAVQKDGVYEEHLEYDSRGNCISHRMYDRQGNLCNNEEGVASQISVYDEQGRKLFYQSYDSSGNSPTEVNFREDFEYDDRGNAIHNTIYYIGADGEEGHVTMDCEYDDRDNLLSQSYADESGALLKVGEAAVTINEYDSQNRIIRIAKYDADGSYSNDGFAVIAYKYDAFGRNSDEEYYFVYEDSSPELSLRIEYTYDEYGFRSAGFTYDADGTLICGENGVAGYTRDFDVQGNMVRLTYYDHGLKPIFNTDRGYAVTEIAYNAIGQIVKYTYYDADGKLMTRESGYPAYMESSYNSLGYLTEISYYDEAVKLFRCQDRDYARIVCFTDKRGENVYIESYDEENHLNSTAVAVLAVEDVMEGSKAAECGILSGDIILKYAAWDFLGYEHYQDIDFMDFDSAIAEAYDTEKDIIWCRKEGGSYVFMRETFGAGLVGMHYSVKRYTMETVEQIKSSF